MWRPIALSAFVALVFMASRSVQPPIETDIGDAGKGDFGAKSDFGARASGDDAASPPIKIDLARSSAHPKPVGTAAPEDTGADAVQSAHVDQTDADSVQTEQVAELSVSGAQTIPLPVPKTGGSTGGMRVVVTEGEQKTALTSGEEDALSLMPPGPDFAAKVQRELARLGCYRGRVDNIWGPMSRNAVARFNRVAKAKLPLKQPTRALLSSARQAPDGYCTGAAVASDGQQKVAALEPGAGVEALKQRPSYLPPWMRGEPMPGPDENLVTQQPEPKAEPEQPATRTAARDEPTATRTSASRAERQARRARAQRRVQRRRTRSFGAVMDGRGAFWPGQ